MSHRIEVILVVAAPDGSGRSKMTFLVHKRADCLFSLPKMILPTDASTLQVADILLLSIGLRARIGVGGWVEVKQLGLMDNVDRRDEQGRLIGVVYGCVLPEVITAPTDGVWLSLTDMGNCQLVSDHRDIILFAGLNL